MLPKVTMEEKFRFMFNKQIHDAVDSTQEGLHSIKLNKLLAAAMKITLSKDSNKVGFAANRYGSIYYLDPRLCFIRKFCTPNTWFSLLKSALKIIHVYWLSLA